MAKVAQKVLGFNLEATQEDLTAHAGLGLFGEFLHGLKLPQWLKKCMPGPGSGRGYTADAYVMPLIMMLTGGGRSLEDLRMLEGDTALAHLLEREGLPSPDAVGDWLRRTGAGDGLAGLAQINQHIVAEQLKQTGRCQHTLDGDASQIVAEKQGAEFTYKGEQGYMPMIGHLAEAGVVIHDEFRAGNVAPATDNLGFIKACEAQLPAGHRITRVRLDAAGYQAGIVNYCESNGKSFAIGGQLDGPTREAIAALPDSAWQRHSQRPGCWLAETLHCMNDTEQAFRLIVVRHEHQGDLFDDRTRDHVIVSNRVESTEATVAWYHQRGETSENSIKELKIGFGMERMPCGQLAANAAFFRIGTLAHNLFVLFQHTTLDRSWCRHQVATVRWRLFDIPGKVIRTGRTWQLKIAEEAIELFRLIRARSAELAQTAALP